MKKTIFWHLNDEMPTEHEVRELLDRQRSIWSRSLLATYFDNAWRTERGGHGVIFKLRMHSSLDDVSSLWDTAERQFRRLSWVLTVTVIAMIGVSISLLTYAVSTTSFLPMVVAVLFCAALCQVVTRYIVPVRENWWRAKQFSFRLLQIACSDLKLLRYHTTQDDPEFERNLLIPERIRILTSQGSIWAIVRRRLVILKMAQHGQEIVDRKFSDSEYTALENRLHRMMSRFFGQNNLDTDSEQEAIESEASAEMIEWLRLTPEERSKLPRTEAERCRAAR